MPVPIELLRAMLAVLCVFFAHMLGRSAGGVFHGETRRGRMYGWLVRVLITAFAIGTGRRLGGLGRSAPPPERRRPQQADLPRVASTAAV
jgi:hypothetical protein